MRQLDKDCRRARTAIQADQSWHHLHHRGRQHRLLWNTRMMAVLEQVDEKPSGLVETMGRIDHLIRNKEHIITTRQTELSSNIMI